jgi:hypothetical protein
MKLAMVLKIPYHLAFVCLGLMQNVALDLVAVVSKGYFSEAACSPKPAQLVGLQVVLLPPLILDSTSPSLSIFLLSCGKESLILLLPPECNFSIFFCPSLLVSLCMVVSVWSSRHDGQRWLNTSLSQLANTIGVICRFR